MTNETMKDRLDSKRRDLVGKLVKVLSISHTLPMHAYSMHVIEHWSEYWSKNYTYVTLAEMEQDLCYGDLYEIKDVIFDSFKCMYMLHLQGVKYKTREFVAKENGVAMVDEHFGIYRDPYYLSKIPRKIDPKMRTFTARFRLQDDREIEIPTPGPGWVMEEEKKYSEWPSTHINCVNLDRPMEDDAGNCWWHDYKKVVYKENAKVLWIKTYSKDRKTEEKESYIKTREWL